MRSAMCLPTAVIQRIRAEYQEAPGLRLTVTEAERFMGLDRRTCEQAFTQLEQTGFLFRGARGTYQRA